MAARISRLTLSEWFDEWFENYKVPYVKETSVFLMRSKFYNSFGKRLGDITNIDVQNVITQMNKEGKAASTMCEALGRMRECMESAKNDRLIPINQRKLTCRNPFKRCGSNENRLFLKICILTQSGIRFAADVLRQICSLR